MKFKEIQLTNFRNYSSQICQFESNLCVFIGDNGQGKTNILESLYFMSILKSFRTNENKDLIFKNSPYSFLKATIEDENIQKQLYIYLTEKGKGLKINYDFVKNNSQFIGLINTVLFSPYDLIFFDESPKFRRRFMDMELSKISSVYLSYLNQYNLLLKQRNSLLKQTEIDQLTLSILSDQLIEKMYEIRKFRKEFIYFISKKTNFYFSKLSKDIFDIEINYLQDGFDEDKQKFIVNMKNKFEANQQRDILFKTTHYGIHRDDMECLINKINLLSFASQGQKRLVLLSLKLALVDYILETTKKTPVLLLDDVLSELDYDHQHRFLELCSSEVQIILTTVSLDQIKPLKIKPQVFYVKQGSISLMDDIQQGGYNGRK